MKLEPRLIVPPGALARADRAPAAREARRRGIQVARRLFALDPEIARSSCSIASIWHYAGFVLGPAPEEVQRPWAAAPERVLLADPRVCAFADGYERERLRLLHLEPVPSDLHALERWADCVHRHALEAAADPTACATDPWADLDTMRRLSHLTVMLRNAARHAAEEGTR